jgi:hypothetical protein
MSEETIKEILANVSKSDVPVSTEEFSNYIITEAEKGRKLKGIISATAEDLTKGSSDTVKVPYFPTVAMETPGESGANDLTAAGYTVNESSVSLTRYGKNILLGAESIWHCKYDVVQRILDAMARGYRNVQDNAIVTALLLDGAAVYTTNTPIAATSVADFTSTPVYLYDAIRDTIKSLKENDLDDLTHVVMSPEGEAALISLVGDTNKTYLLTVDSGKVTEIFGLPVIVSSYVVTYANATQYDGVCAVLDKSRAIAEATGKPASYEEQRDASKDGTEQVFNAYWGCALLDCNGTPEMGIIYKA